jgi:type I restriction enzyme, S subunit
MRMSSAQVPEGYKQTEVGMIPEDWEVVLLGDLAEKIGSGITPTGGSRVYKDYGRPFIRSQNVGWGKLKLDDLAYINEETH